LAQPSLAQTINYLMLADQRLIEPVGILRNIETYIMGISTSVDFELIDLVNGMPTYPTLVGRPWGRQMKENISLEKDRIKLKGNGRKIIIPLDPNEGKPGSESLDEYQKTICLYQIFNEQ
jgi:hypothetical protein